MNITEAFLDYLYTRNASISPEVLHKARYCLLDYLGAAYAGCRETAENLPVEPVEGGACSVLGTARKTDALQAAFLNAYNAHVQELDDGHRFGAIHLGAAIVSALLAVAQEQQALGAPCGEEALCRGIVLGYETAVRCGAAMQPGHKKQGFHTSGTCGTIGAAAGIAFMLGYNRQQLKTTLSGAATCAAGVLEIQEDASKMKPYNLGHAAMSAVMAAKIGRTALTPPEDILGGPRGVLRILTDCFSEEKLLQQTPLFEIQRIYVKPYAACRHCHPAVEAAVQLRRETGIPANAVEEIRVATYEQAVRGHDHRNIQGAASAKLSLPFCVAAAYATGECGIDTFSPAQITDRALLALTEKVLVEVEPDFTRQCPQKRMSRVCIRSGDREYRCTVEYAKGEPENPMTDGEIESKFLTLMTWAGEHARGARILHHFHTQNWSCLLQCL